MYTSSKVKVTSDGFGVTVTESLFNHQQMDSDVTGTESVYTVGTFDSVVESIVEESPPVPLTVDMIKGGLRRIGYHPLTMKHSFLELVLCGTGLNGIDQLSLYPNIMFLDVSSNKIESLRVLCKLTTLVELNASHNSIRTCLNFTAPLCNSTHAWRDGHKAVGSLLTKADLSHNKIERLSDLSDHKFLESLLLSHNSISDIGGMHNLKYLQV